MNTTAHAARIEYLGARQGHDAATSIIRRYTTSRRLSRAERALTALTNVGGYCTATDYARLTGATV